MFKMDQIQDKLEKIRDETEALDDLISSNALLEFIAEWLRDKPRYRSVSCCSTEFKVDALEVYFNCPSCKRKSKLRGFGPIYDDLEDLIVDVRTWLLEGPEGLKKRYEPPKG